MCGLHPFLHVYLLVHKSSHASVSFEFCYTVLSHQTVDCIQNRAQRAKYKDSSGPFEKRSLWFSAQLLASSICNLLYSRSTYF